MKWGKTDTTKMDNNHLKNTINWCKKQLNSENMNLKYHLIKEILTSFRYAQIACIEAELLFRLNGIDNRNTSEIVFSNIENILNFYQKNEKMFRINNWETQLERATRLRIESDNHFEDTFGHSPYFEDDDEPDYLIHDNQYTN